MLVMSEVLKVHTGPSIQSNVTHVKGVKVHKGPSIQSNVTHVEGVEIAYRASQYRVMLLMLKVSKVAQYTL